MPPPVKITKQNVLDAALTLTRERGAEALNARALAGALGCSTQPIFHNFASMEQLRLEVIRLADRVYQDFLAREMSRTDVSPYMASGLGYIRFAVEEPNLFRLLFMRDRSAEPPVPDPTLDDVLLPLQRATGLSRSEAERFHLHMWVVVHGVAVMLVSAFLSWDEPQIERLLSEAYQGQLLRCRAEKQKEAVQ